jgi:hypothetical protein
MVFGMCQKRATRCSLWCAAAFIASEAAAEYKRLFSFSLFLTSYIDISLLIFFFATSGLLAQGCGALLSLCVRTHFSQLSAPLFAAAVDLFIYSPLFTHISVPFKERDHV